MKANDALFQAGKTYYDTYSAAVNAIDLVLVNHGWDCERIGYHTNLSANCVHIHEEIGDGLWLTATLYRMGSTGRWEVVAYVS